MNHIGNRCPLLFTNVVVQYPNIPVDVIFIILYITTLKLYNRTTDKFWNIIVMTSLICTTLIIINSKQVKKLCNVCFFYWMWLFWYVVIIKQSREKITLCTQSLQKIVRYLLSSIIFFLSITFLLSKVIKRGYNWKNICYLMLAKSAEAGIKFWSVFLQALLISPPKPYRVDCIILMTRQHRVCFQRRVRRMGELGA